MQTDTAVNAGQAPAPWHMMSVSEAATRLSSSPETGLSAAEAAARLAGDGPNEIPELAPRTLLGMIAGQFTDVLIVILLCAALIAALLGDHKDAIVIAAIVLLNAVIGVVQEWRAERALSALKKMLAPTAFVVRDGESSRITAADVVEGDVVALTEGEIVPADVRIVAASALRMDESLLTGESVPVDKQSLALAGVDGDAARLPLGDRMNMAFKGTIVAHGSGTGLVVATALRTELGKIAGLLQHEDTSRTPLQRRLAGFSRDLASAILAICLVFFLFGLFRGEPWLLMFMTAVSLAVAAIPEALPAMVTVALAMSARAMARKKALVRGLPAVEALGSVSYICTDKTGTLTLNRMQVTALRTVAGTRMQEPGDGEGTQRLFTAMALCSDARQQADGTFIGDPTETAIVERAQAAGVRRTDLEGRLPRVAAFPFDAERKRMTTLHRLASGETVAFTKGAPEVVVPLCTGVMTPEGIAEIDVASITDGAAALAGEGLRVIAVAERRLPPGEEAGTAATVEQDLVFLGLVGLIDPPRPEARHAVELCRAAGITPVMLTGDHPDTARAIACAIGILDGGGRVLTGPELENLDAVGFATVAADISVYARVSPAQKIRIVEALQAEGAFVAMTGDGVNDAPALKRADIGVAMGESGTDVAKEASRLVLLDDNFATIVSAVREGRRIYDNIRKFIKYTMTSNSAEMLVVVIPPLFGLPLALFPVHILWINLVTDALPGLALAFEGEEEGTMRRPPRAPDESVFAGGMVWHVLIYGSVMAGLAIATQAWAFQAGNAHWQTMVFTVLTLSQMGHVLAIRADRKSLWELGLYSNPPLLLAVTLTCALQLALIYVPALNVVFDTQPLSLLELLCCVAISALVLVLIEVEKAIRRYRSAT